MKTAAGVCAVLLWLPAPVTAAAPGAGLDSLRQGPLTVTHAPQDASLARQLARAGERIHRSIVEDLGLAHTVHVRVLLLTDSVDGATRDDLDPRLPSWLAGAAWAGRRRIVLTVRPGENSSDLETILAHELTHVILEEDFPGQGAWPLWFREGIAMRQSGQEGLRRRAALSVAALRGRIIPLGSLWTAFPDDEGGARLAYAESFAVISYLVAEHGEERFRSLMNALRAEEFEDAFREVYGFGTGAMEGRWRKWVGRRYSWIPLVTGGTAFWALTMAVFFVALAVRRRRNRLIEERWETEEGWPPRFPW